MERKMTELRTGGVMIGVARSPFLEAGPSNASEAAVFVHGDPGSSRDWEDLMAPVGQFGRAVAPDMPGFGNAEEPEGFDRTSEGHARHLGGFLEEIGVRRAHLILRGSGGPWGLGWAMQNPDAFASVVLMNTGVMLDHGRRGPAPALYHVTNSARTGGRRMEAPRLPRRPALVLWGARDSSFPVRYAEEQREVFPGARIVALDESGPLVDDPETVVDEVVLFLRRNFAAR